MSIKQRILNALSTFKQPAAEVASSIGIDTEMAQRALWSLNKEGKVQKHGHTRGAAWTVKGDTLPALEQTNKTNKQQIRMIGIMRGCGRAFVEFNGSLCFVTPLYSAGPHPLRPDMAAQVTNTAMIREGFEIVDELFQTENELYECLLADWKQLRPMNGNEKYVMDDEFDVLEELHPAIFSIFLEGLSRDYTAGNFDVVSKIGNELLNRNIELEDEDVYKRAKVLVNAATIHLMTNNQIKAIC